MNGQNPNNQINGQGGQNIANGVNPSVLGSVSPTPVANQTPQPQVTPNASPTGQNVGTTLGTAQPVNPNPAPAAPVTPNQNIGAVPSGNQTNMNQVGTPANNVNNQAQPQGPSAVETTRSINNPTPVAQPIPGTSGTPYQANSLTGNTVGVGSPSVGQDSLNSNGFANPNKIEDIGTIPPTNNVSATKNPKNKKPMNKVLFIIIIIVLIAAVAFGVYYFLSISNKAKVTLKNVTIGVGEILSDNINDYATISGSEAGNCTLNTRNVDTSNIGEYEFSITCGEDTYTGKITVNDVTLPEIVVNAVYKTVNSTAIIDDFVVSCTDSSDCDVNFVDENVVNGYLATAGGPYSIEIKATDGAGNERAVTAPLYVTPYPIQFFRNCESGSTEVTGYQATRTITDFLPMGSNGTEPVYLGVSQRFYTYVFTSEEEYRDVVGDKPLELNFDGITGYTVYNDESLTFQIQTALSLETLNSEANGAFPTTYVGIAPYYTNLGYTCSNTLPE